MKNKGQYKLIAHCMLAFSLLLTLTACGGSSGSSPSSSPGGSSSDSMSSAREAEDGFNTTTAESAADSSAAEALSAPFASAIPAGAKVIRRAELSMETKEYDKSRALLEQLTAQHGGYFEQMTTEGKEGTRYAYYTVRVPRDRLDAFLTAAGSSFHVIRQSQSAEDISEQYFDIDTRLSVLRAKHERLLMLLNKAEKMEDIIQLEDVLSETQLHIDELSGALRGYDSLVNFSSVSIQLNEVLDLSATQSGNTFGARVSTSAQSGANTLVVFVQSFLIVAVLMWPVLLLLLIALVVVLYVRKKRRAKRAAIEQNAHDKDSDPPCDT